MFEVYMEWSGGGSGPKVGFMLLIIPYPSMNRDLKCRHKVHIQYLNPFCVLTRPS
jgi:hypothetical protein